MNSMDIDESRSQEFSSNFNNYIMLNMNMKKGREKNIIFCIFYYYFLFLINVFELFYRIVCYIFEHPALVKPVAGFFTLLGTNLFLFYDFLAPVLEYILNFLLEFDLFSDFYFWIINYMYQGLALLYNLITVIKNIWLSCSLLFYDIIYITFFVLKNTLNLLIFFISDSPDILLKVICHVWSCFNVILIQVLNFVWPLLLFFFKSFGIYCFLVIFFYLILFILDSFDFIFKKKFVFKLIDKISLLICYLRNIFKVFFLIIFKIILLFFKYLFYDLFVLNSQNVENIPSEIINKEPKFLKHHPTKKRAVSFNEQVTIISIDSNDESCQDNNLKDDLTFDIKITTHPKSRLNNNSKKYTPIETFSTIDQAIQRIRDEPVERQYYIKR